MVVGNRWFSLVILVAMVTVLMAGCAKAPAPTQSPAKTSAPAAPAPAKTPTQAPAKTTAPTAAAPKAESLDDFFARNRVTLLVPLAAGGSTDYCARLYASFWTEVTGGSMIVKNNPGGGSIPGLEQIYAAKPDGLTLGFFQAGGLLTRELFENPKPKYDAVKFNWLGYMADEPRFLVTSAKKPYATLQDLQKAKGLKAPSLGPIDTWAISIAVFSEFLGLDAKIIPGFDSATEACLATARGEVDFQPAWSSYFGLMLKKGDYKGPFAILQRQRSPLHPDVPAITELAKMTPDLDKYLSLAEAMFAGRAPIAPANMDKARVDFLRAKTKQIFALKSFVQQAKLQFKEWEPPLSGEEMQRAVEKAMSLDRAAAGEVVNKIIRPRIMAK